jgi:hypothetical protein
MKDIHADDCYKKGGKKDCPLKGNGSNPKFYAPCYQDLSAEKDNPIFEEKMIDIHEVANDLIQQESLILDREMTEFLSKHNLPLDRNKIRNLGFEIITETVLPPEEFSTTRYKFKLCKVIDEHRVAIKRNINIV